MHRIDCNMQPVQRWLRAFLLIALCAQPALRARAATRTWTGNGADANWSTPANWAGSTAPVTGDDLVFPPAAARLANNNNFAAGTVFNSLTFSGTNYSLSGASIQLNAGLSAANTAFANTVQFPLTLRSNQTFTSGNVGVSLNLQGAIDNNGKDLTVAGQGILQVTGVLSGGGGLAKTGTGSLSLYASNTFSGAVQILQGQVSAYHGSALGLTNGSTTVSDGASLFLANTITVAEPLLLAGTLTSGGSGAKTFSGPVTLSGSNATFQVGLNAPLTISGLMSGTYGFSKTDVDQLTLTANNTYQGTTVLNGGTLAIQGSQVQSAITVNSGVFAASGLVGPVTCAGQSTKRISPAGNLTGHLVTSSVSFDDTTTVALQLNGTLAGAQHDQLEVEGGVVPAVFLNNAFLSLTLGFTPAPGNSFLILNNTGTMPVNGTFLGLREGAVFTNNTSVFQITYQGGDGNDVVLTCVNPPAKLSGIVRLTNGVVQFQGAGAANAAYTVQASTNLANWSAIGTAAANSSGLFTFSDTNALSFPERFYRAVWP